MAGSAKRKVTTEYASPFAAAHICRAGLRQDLQSECVEPSGRGITLNTGGLLSPQRLRLLT
jgi:hypothetical protein